MRYDTHIFFNSSACCPSQRCKWYEGPRPPPHTKRKKETNTAPRGRLRVTLGRYVLTERSVLPTERSLLRTERFVLPTERSLLPTERFVLPTERFVESSAVLQVSIWYNACARSAVSVRRKPGRTVCRHVMAQRLVYITVL